jgi:hypothetical protein
VEEVFNTRFIANEAEALVDEQASNCSRRHTVTSDVPCPASCGRRPRASGGRRARIGWPGVWCVPYAPWPISPGVSEAADAGYGGSSLSGPMATRPHEGFHPLTALTI